MEIKKRNPQIFLFAGQVRSGKDTTAGYLHDYYQARNKKCINLQFSSYLKEYAKHITGWDGSDENKPRELLQQLGTELIRATIDNEFFIKRILDDIKVYSYFFDVITISDVRFDLEIKRVKEAYPSAFLFLLKRDVDNHLDTLREHITEHGLSDTNTYDAIIDNNGTLEDLKHKVEVLLEGSETHELER